MAKKEPLRLDAGLIREAELAAVIQKRSMPAQIEFWAEIGKRITASLSLNDTLALLHGIATLKVSMPRGQPVDPKEVAEAAQRASQIPFTAQVPIYEASPTHPGYLDRILPDGTRETGHFKDGQFQRKDVKRGVTA